MTDPMVPLPAAMSAFYDLPSAVPFRFPRVESSLPTLVRLEELAARLDAADKAEGSAPPDTNAAEPLRLFRRDWPDIRAVERYLARGNASMAGHLAEKLVAAHPRRPAGHFALGRAALLRGEWGAAVAACRAALDLYPGSFEIGRELLLALAASGDMSGARALLAGMDDSMEARTLERQFGSALACDDASALLARATGLGRFQASMASEAEDTDRAAVIRELVTRHPIDAPILELAARAAMEIGEAPLARSLADRSTRLDRNAVDGWMVLSELALREGHHPEAERTALLAREAAPDSRPALILLAKVLRADKRPAEAARIIQTGCERWPEDRQLRMILAGSLLQSGDVAAAVNELESSLARWPGDPVGWFQLGKMAEITGDLVRARTAYDLARGGAERFDEAREAAALLQARRGDIDTARRELAAMTEEDPLSPFGWRGLGDLDLATRPSEAARCYAEALARRPGLAMAGVEHLAGLTELNERRFATAVHRFEAAVQLDPRRHEAWCGLGVSLHRTGRHDEALRAMAEAARLEPNQAGYHANMAEFYQSAFRRNPLLRWRCLGLARQSRRRSVEIPPAKQAGA